MPIPLDPTSAAFLYAENRNQPMHVAGLQLFEKPEDAPEDFLSQVYQSALEQDRPTPLFAKRPIRSLTSAAQWAWTPDAQFDIEYHVRHSALPEPGRVRELLELASRLHGTRLARERPLWEVHLIEGLRDGRVAMYFKIHHALVDGISAMRLMSKVLSDDPDERDMLMPWAAKTSRKKADKAPAGLASLPLDALRSALGISADAAGLPGALVKTIRKGLRNETSALSFNAPKTMFNQPITGSRRCAAQTWPLERLQAIGKASGTTLNDVVLAMCSGALRSYLIEHDGLPDASLVSMVPVGLKAGRSANAGDGGNAVGAVMVQLGTDLDDPAARLSAIHASMKDGKEALSSMTPLQILAMSALGMTPAVVWPMLGLHNIVRPPFNLVISNVPGPRNTKYLNGAKLVGSYPLSIPMQGQAMNITCNSYDQQMDFGLTGCRRTVPHLQRLLGHLDDELTALESAAGVS